jgi:hypothetical protein
MRSSSELLLRISLHDTNAKMVKTRSNKNYVNVLKTADAPSVNVRMAFEQLTTIAMPPPKEKLRNMILQ